MVRVRFAPSPTGPLHIGGVRTALYSYLYAKKMGGTMILRIEDTDQNRYVPGAEEYIIKALDWVGISIDEGPHIGGPHAPYRQSEKKEIYQKIAYQLIQEGKAYYAFDTAEELDELRKKAEASGASFQYNAATRLNLKNSLTLSANEVKSLLADGKTEYVIRLKVPAKEEIRFRDEIRDWVVVHSSSIDDKVLMKSDGMPTYHLAHIVDDHEMKITHVIRGEEWLPSAPFHILLYKALGWEATMPVFAHLPLLLKPEGHGKLSKRDADLGGYPVFPLAWNGTEMKAIGFKEEGYLPNALVNFLAFLGWNPGTEQEIFSMEELAQAFSLDRIGKAGAKFDINKAKWFNQEYLKKLPIETLAKDYQKIAAENGQNISNDLAEKIVNLLRERVTFTKDLWTESAFLYHFEPIFDETVTQKWSVDAAKILNPFTEKIQSLQDYNHDSIKNTFIGICENEGLKFGKLMPSLRIATTGATSGPDLMDILVILGKEKVAERIASSIKKLG